MDREEEEGEGGKGKTELVWVGRRERKRRNREGKNECMCCRDRNVYGAYIPTIKFNVANDVAEVFECLEASGREEAV